MDDCLNETSDKRMIKIIDKIVITIIYPGNLLNFQSVAFDDIYLKNKHVDDSIQKTYNSKHDRYAQIVKQSY